MWTTGGCDAAKSGYQVNAHYRVPGTRYRDFLRVKAVYVRHQSVSLTAALCSRAAEEEEEAEPRVADALSIDPAVLASIRYHEKTLIWMDGSTDD